VRRGLRRPRCLSPQPRQRLDGSHGRRGALLIVGAYLASFFVIYFNVDRGGRAGAIAEDQAVGPFSAPELETAVRTR